MDLGTTRRTKAEMVRNLRQHFRPGTYDLLRKNCNSFSDCAMYFLLQQRLPAEYRTLEQLGVGASPVVTPILERVAGGPLTITLDFDLEEVIRQIEATLPADEIGRTKPKTEEEKKKDAILAEDERLARVLQANEEFWARGGTCARGRSDEDVARAMQRDLDTEANKGSPQRQCMSPSLQQAAARAGALMNQVGQTMQEKVGRVQDQVSRVDLQQQAGHVREQVGQHAGRLRDEVRQSVHEAQAQVGQIRERCGQRAADSLEQLQRQRSRGSEQMQARISSVNNVLSGLATQKARTESGQMQHMQPRTYTISV